MKKSIAARNYWFNYTARKNYEYQMRQEKMTIQRKFTHALTKQYAFLMNFFVNVYHWIAWKIGKMFKKVSQ